MVSDSINAMGRTVQNTIDSDISVYDPPFKRYRDEYGDAFVREYLSEVSTHMAHRIVRAFEEHDRKRYQQSARSFGTVYTFLFPVRPTTAHTAGTSYSLALKQHDAIEDGVHAVADHEPIIDDYIGDDAGISRTARDILHHPYWDAVLFCFELVVDALDLPHAYAEEQTEFFRYHTAAHEATDHRDTNHEELEAIALRHAKRAQTTKFGQFFDDNDTLDWVADVYLDAVKSHDAHTPSDQGANVSRMITIYDHAPSAVVGVEPFTQRVADSSTEAARRPQ